MELNVKLTADELMNVVDAAMDEAMDRGYDVLDVDELTDDMLHIVDAALSAMGIEVTEDTDTEEVDAFGVPADYDSDFDEEEEEDEDFDPIDEMAYVLDDGRGAISFADACYLMDSIREVLQKNGMDTSDAPEIFMNICREHGIEVVDNSIDNEDEEEEEEEETPSNPIEAMIVERNGERYLKETDAKLLLDTLRELVYSAAEDRPEAIREQILCDIWCAIGEDYRIKGILKGE